MMPDWLGLARQAEVLYDQNQLDQAASLAEESLRLNPLSALALQVLGCVHSRHHRYPEAVARLQQALSLQPDLVPAHNELGLAYFQLGDTDAALRHFDLALCVQPDHPFSHFNRALAWLRRGRFREGWVEYEWRWKCNLVSRPDVPRPRWDGSPLHGRGLFVHSEQGIGDVLQFVRFFPLVKQHGARLVFACQKPLQSLLRTLPEVDEWFPVDTPGEMRFDACIPLMSLPAALGVEEADIPRSVPYLPVDPERVRRWESRLSPLPGFKVGLCWQGSPTHRGDALRSIPLAHFAPLARVPSVHLISLQKGAGEEQIEAQGENVPLTVLEGRDADGGLVDTAAVLQHLDLVITCDTAVAHLAGALGRPVWVLLPVASDWRWLEQRSDSPWYPTMRLFRQRTWGNWAEVFARVQGALRFEVEGL
jgi:ADP-heptose:LPS heptosyltransferase